LRHISTKNVAVQVTYDILLLSEKIKNCGEELMENKKFFRTMIPILVVIILALAFVWGVFFKLQSENDALLAEQSELYLQSEAAARGMVEFGEAFDLQREEADALRQEIRDLKEEKAEQLQKYEELVEENEEIKDLL